MAGNCNNHNVVAAIRPIAASVAIVAGSREYEIWRQQADSNPQLLDHITPENLHNYFDRNRDALAPHAIYRHKVWGRLEPKQLDFVDVGLLPVLEEEMGKRITELTVRAVDGARVSLGWKKPTPEQGQWLIKAVFWILAAKILQDKQVDRFIRLDWGDLDSVFERLANHYNSRQPTPVRMSRDRREALLAAAAEIKRFAHLGLLSTESLAYLYESALIDKATRQSLGTHSTPSWMVDYVVGKLRPWIEEMPVEGRRILEPACGHAGFLISGLRLLSELRPSNYNEDRRLYLRKRLRGIEYESFAVEIARLSLTLADVPNPNGWALNHADMFAGDLLAKEAAAATIVLCNPPFERFAESERRPEWQLNKATETFRRVLENLPAGGVFGFVLPYSFLKSTQDAELRRRLLSECELSEVSLFADKVFRCGSSESAVILGRKHSAPRATVLYQRVREAQIETFKHDYTPSSRERLPQSVFFSKNRGSLFFAELSDLWGAVAHLPRLGDIAEIGQGFSHKGEDDETAPKGAIRESARRQDGLIPGFARSAASQMTHQLPPETWLNLTETLISRPRSGVIRGKAQVILNYPRVSREGWCLKAMIDGSGHPVTSDFSVVRPVNVSLLVVWAILNSPLGNAFARTHSNKKQILVGMLSSLPIPDLFSQDLTALERAVSAYLEAAETFSNIRNQSPPLRKGKKRQEKAPRVAQGELFESTQSITKTEEDLKALHWRVDAEVLRLYNLPAPLERKLLVFFSGVERRGVPFRQIEYFPERVSYLNRLCDLIAITKEWDIHAARKEELIEKKVRRNATAEELTELQELKRLTSARRELFVPLPVKALEGVKTDLIRRGIWRED